MRERVREGERERVRERVRKRMRERVIYMVSEGERKRGI